MEEAPEEDVKCEISRENSNCTEDLHPPSPVKDALMSELESLRFAYGELQSRYAAMEETLSNLRCRNHNLSDALEEASREQDSLRIKLLEAEVYAKEREEADEKARSEVMNEVQIVRAEVSMLLGEKSRKERVYLEVLDSMRLAKECLWRIAQRMGAKNLENYVKGESSLEDDLKNLSSEARCVRNLVSDVESIFLRYEEMINKEKKEFENNISSLTEENRDISSLLRVALVEKEAVEKTLSRMKGSGEQRRVAILQIAEWGLQKAGFGFRMGASTGESLTDNLSSSNASMKSDGSECEEEGSSLASTVEKIMKNLRREITELRQCLDESRSDCEHLKSLTDKHTQEIAESKLYIKCLEERETMLVQNVEDLTIEIKEVEEEVVRWREACELEVEAGQAAIAECEREVAILREDLERTKAALDASNNKLKLKEKLAVTAMAAQAAAESSLRLADSRSVALRQRIEELTRQLEEEANRSGREQTVGGRRRVRHVCWPWPALRINPSASAPSGHSSRNESRRMLPDMEALLH